ncbi:MAG: hypothetical protein HY912_08815 [Desulfomonile tiedjei]|uniref:Uncharacterized protein n=1 Tax=Desulfomonile tiedjei TaxID=2358 RepID=A0A9D6Z3G5_9BACT|nr:hypothetical protein [Desulfomonile tiedjei]
MKEKQSRTEVGDAQVALYHNVFRRDDFEKTAYILFNLVKEAQRLHPGKKRILFLDIEGHRNEQGGYDPDMLELQQEFLVGFLLNFLTEVHSPLASVRNSGMQEDAVPEALTVRDRQ